MNLYGVEFVRRLTESGLEPATVNKHCRELNTIFLKLGPKSLGNRDAKALLEYCPSFLPPRYDVKDPREFSDEDFQSLFNAFNHETEYPLHLPVAMRPLYWQAIMVFVSIVAVRRGAVLGVEWRDINRQEMFIKIRAEIDKKNKIRYKEIKPELIDWLEKIRPSYVLWNSENKIFEWNQSDNTWYECWRRAEKIAGIKMGLHDLKRFSGELAMRAGADPLVLKEHMDHVDIKTTFKHYCRPKTRGMVSKIIVPIPGLESTPPATTTPPPLEPLKIAPAFQFDSMPEVNRFCQKEMKRIENAEIVVRTSSGTILTVLNESKEETHVNESPNSQPPNKDIRNGNSAG